MQLELIALDTLDPLILSDIIPGNCVKITGSGRIVMRVKATGFLLNSTIIADVINRNDCLVVDMQKGTLYSMRGTTPVTRIISKLLHTDKTQGER